MHTVISTKLATSPCHLIAKNSEGLYIAVNQAIAEFAGLNSPKEMIGGTDHDFIWHQRHELYRRNDLATEQSRSPFYCIEPSRSSQKELVHVLSVRAPLFKPNGEVYGMAGIITSLDQQPYSKIISEFIFAAETLHFDLNPNILLQVVSRTIQLDKMGKQWQHEKPLFQYGTLKFTFREAQCLHYLLNSHSARQTAEKLFISPKTVEFHIAKIKEKTECKSVSQITNKAIDQGFIDLLFMNFD